MSDNSCCHHCGARLTGRWESLNKGLCKTLIKFYQAICAKRRNSLHLQDEGNFTKNEYNNFQKLQYFGLVCRSRERAGTWMLTLRGHFFIINQITMPKKVFIFRNAVRKKSNEFTTIAGALKSAPYWLQRDDFLAQIDQYQVNLF